MKRLPLLACLVWAVTASAQVPSYVPTDGLVGWFAMDGDITNEVNGASGSAIGTTAEPDRNGQAGASLGFNGAAYGVLQNAGMPAGEFTISTWVKQSQSWSTGAGIEFICVGSSANTSWGTVAGPEFIHLNRGRGCSGNGQVLSGVNFPLNEWVHLTYVCAGPGAATEVYLNGASVGQSLNTTSGSCGSSNLYFGVDIFSAPEYITGGLDDVGIWNRQLSAEEVQQVFASEPPIELPTSLPTDGLVAFYPFNGNANDKSGNGHDGTMDGALFGQDREGSASASATFDGVDDGVFIPHHPDFESAEKTISFWMNPTSNQLLDTPGLNDGMGILNKTDHTASNTINRYYAVTLGQGTTGTAPFSLTLATSTGNIVTTGSSVESTTAQDAININEWQHVSAVQTATELKLYLNGIQISASPLLNPPLENDYDIKIGVDYKFNEYRYFNGSIDDISFHNRALSEDEIATMAGVTTTAAIPSYVSPNGLMGWYPFNGNTLDESGNEYHGVAEGTALTTDRFGESESALHFNGIDDELDMPAFFNVGWEEFTISGWFSTDDFNKDNQAIVNTNPHNGIGIGFNHPATLDHTVSLWLNSDPAVSSWDNSSAGHTSITFADNDWHHVSLTKNGLDYVLKVDGSVVFETTVAITPVDYTCAIILGHIDVASGEYFKGTLDDFGFWNRALSEEELEALISEAGIQGCTNPAACNFDADANVDDGSCLLLDCEALCGEGTEWDSELEQCVASAPDTIVVTDTLLVPTPFCGAGTHWDPVTEMCIADVPGTTDENCTVMNLQELAEGYQVLLDHTADQDSIILALQSQNDSLSALPFCACPTSINYQGHNYETVEIDGQCWFAENLRAWNYRNGDAIPEETDGPTWANLTTGAAAAFDNDNSNYETFGLLYNWYAVSDSRGICPLGWHGATESDFQALLTAAGGSSEADVTLRSDEVAWIGSNPDSGTDALGFGLLPGGMRDGYYGHGNFQYFQFYGSLWASDFGYKFLLINGDGEAGIYSNAVSDAGKYVRCVKD